MSVLFSKPSNDAAAKLSSTLLASAYSSALSPNPHSNNTSSIHTTGQSTVVSQSVMQNVVGVHPRAVSNVSNNPFMPSATPPNSAVSPRTNPIFGVVTPAVPVMSPTKVVASTASSNPIMAVNPIMSAATNNSNPFMSPPALVTINPIMAKPVITNAETENKTEKSIEPKEAPKDSFTEAEILAANISLGYLKLGDYELRQIEGRWKLVGGPEIESINQLKRAQAVSDRSATEMAQKFEEIEYRNKVVMALCSQVLCLRLLFLQVGCVRKGSYVTTYSTTRGSIISEKIITLIKFME